jgi:nucleotide-binding universal stress UspA family protein
LFEKILVAIDMSEMAKPVFAQALSLAQKHRANLMLLHVLSSEEDGSPFPIPPNLTDLYPAVGNDLTLESWRQQWEEFEQEGLEVLRSRAEEATSLGVNVEFKQIPGSPARTICKVAREWHADLIVIGHRGRSGLGEMILGSVSNYVLHHSSCSILMVQFSPEDH